MVAPGAQLLVSEFCLCLLNKRQGAWGLTAWALQLACLGSNPDSTNFQPCDLWHLI